MTVATVTVLSVLVDAVLPLPARSVAAFAGRLTVTVPRLVGSTPNVNVLGSTWVSDGLCVGACRPR